VQNVREAQAAERRDFLTHCTDIVTVRMFTQNNCSILSRLTVCVTPGIFSVYTGTPIQSNLYCKNTADRTQQNNRQI